jgi:CDP-diacylglycerol--serine O-phosphatidyltransferase
MNKKLKKFAYMMVSLFTCGNIACGCLSIILLIGGNFEKAAWLLILAIVFDMMDGRVARLTKTTSDFGVQLDSMSDLVSFGLAPSIMMYQLVLSTKSKTGIPIAVLFVLCSALRLAKFNVGAKSNTTSNAFMGLPTPASAGLLISFVLSYELFIEDIINSNCSLGFKTIPILMKNIPVFFNVMPIVMIVLSLLMVSNIPYFSFKKLKLPKTKIFGILILVIVFIWSILIFQITVQNVIFIMFFLYAISGIFSYVVGYMAKSWRILKGGESDGN